MNEIPGGAVWQEAVKREYGDGVEMKGSVYITTTVYKALSRGPT